MFTGIIEEMGTVIRVASSGEAMQLAVQAQRIMSDMHIGDSIAVNGVCLTVTSFTSQQFTMDVMPETFRKTTLHTLTSGSKVNLERAMRADARFGGHIVQGHVDGMGIVRKRERDQNAIVFTIEPQDDALLRYMIDHGSIAIDGISLTIVRVLEQAFTVSIIPHTLQETVLQSRHVGDAVNLECDVLGKYVERLLNYRPHQTNSVMSRDYLAEHGFV